MRGVSLDFLVIAVAVAHHHDTQLIIAQLCQGISHLQHIVALIEHTGHQNKSFGQAKSLAVHLLRLVGHRFGKHLFAHRHNHPDFFGVHAILVHNFTFAKLAHCHHGIHAFQRLLECPVDEKAFRPRIAFGVMLVQQVAHCQHRGNSVAIQSFGNVGRQSVKHLHTMAMRGLHDSLAVVVAKTAAVWRFQMH